MAYYFYEGSVRLKPCDFGKRTYVFSKLPKVLGQKWKLTEHLTGLEPVTSTTPVALFLTELKMLSQHKAPIHTGEIIL